jgi:predicted AAA+ superfamily ATPase
MKHAELIEYIQTQIVQSPKKLAGLANDQQGSPLFKRDIFAVLQQYAIDFQNNKTEPRIIVMPGLRGTGKTTLLAQLFLSLPNVAKLYLSVEEAIKRFDVNLWDIIENYEELISKHIEELREPLFLFLDEIHYDEKWAIFLKTLYDRSKNIMIFCTGSAALLLREQINADVARRVFFVDIYPISFSEYLLFKYNKAPVEEFKHLVKDALLFSTNAKEVFTKLQNNQNKLDQYWLDIDKFEIQRYLKLGTFPFTLNLNNESIALSFVAQIINKVVYTDIPQFHKFEIETLNRIDKILYLLSDTLGVSVTKLSETLNMKPDTLHLILRALENSGLLLKIPPYGAHFKQIKKPSKYLFATPALRISYLASKESTGIFDVYQGSLLEDIVGMYLNMTIPKFGSGYLTYDPADGGADFIVSTNDKNIVFEVGVGKKDYKQVIQTAQKINPQYSLVISNNTLEYSATINAAKIPLKYFLLMH